MLSWYAINSKPRSERFVNDGLVERGVEAYLPTWRPPKHGTRLQRPRPFFPCYLFAHADLDPVGLSALQYQPGVRRLVFCGDEPARVPEAVIERIRRQLGVMETSLIDASGQPLRAGDQVVITKGPLAGLDAILDCRTSSDERVRLLVNFLQKGTRVDIPCEWVQKKTRARFVVK